MPSVITLLTDFGLSDSYVAAMKGVILSINPEAQIVDMTHEVQAQNIDQASFLLKAAYRYFPPETIHVVVVDPGVGTERRPIAARAGRWTFVAPDNGVLTPIVQAHDDFQAFQISERRFMLPRVSRTFHGRDVFVPAAAYLSLGTPISALGPLVLDPMLLALTPNPDDDTFEGQIIHIDKFGNCITDIEETKFRKWTPGSVTIEAAGQIVRGPVDTYDDAVIGEPIALFGSAGHLEIAVAQGSAAECLKLRLGSEVLARRRAG